MDHLIPPHGGSLIDLLADEERVAELRAASRDWPSWDLEPRQQCDLELLLNGGLSPLRGYMDADEHASVCSDMRLADGTLWPLPVTLDVSDALAGRLEPGGQLALRDAEGVMLAVVTVREVYAPDRDLEATALFGTSDPGDPRVDRFRARRHPAAVAGTVEGVQPPAHHDYRDLRLTPLELRRSFARSGWRRVLAFQTHQTMHRAQQAVTERTALDLSANLLLHPTVGLSRPGDADHYTRVRCYQRLLPHYPRSMVRLSLLPLAARSGGPREALLHGLVHRNHGCTHFMVEHEGGGAVLETTGAPAWDPDEALELLRSHRDEVQIEMVPYREAVWLPGHRRYVSVDEVAEDARPERITAGEVRRRLGAGSELPEWYTFDEVERELRRRHPPRSRQGFTVFFTGLSGSGKSTIANVLRVKLMEGGSRGVTLLDGDLVRKNLSSELGFSREHRDLNIRRIGFVAAEITRAGGIAICAPIAPYDVTRREVREAVEASGGFILVHVSTPLEVCESRDRKGMYAKARAGIIKEFTGISDPYEEPADAEVCIDTSDVTPEEATREVMLFLQREGYIPSASEA